MLDPKKLSFKNHEMNDPCGSTIGHIIDFYHERVCGV